MSDSEIRKNVVTIDRETASNEFARWARAMRLRIDRVRNVNERRDLEDDREHIIDLICDGIVIIGDDNLLVYNPEESDPLTFYRYKGHALVEMDKKRPTDEIGKMIALAGAVTRTSEATIKGLYPQEIMDVTMITSLFLV